MNNLDNWNRLSKEDQIALLEWYNIREEDIDRDDQIRLGNLFADGNFSYWLCPECEEPIFIGNPSNWDHFQGVCQNEALGQLCIECANVYLRLKELADEN